MTKNTYGCVLAFLRDEATGPVLETSGPFTEEVRMAGYDIDDHTVPPTDMRGLAVFEGWVEVGHGEDPDVEWSGGWRMLTQWELVKLRHGEHLWPTEAG